MQTLDRPNARKRLGGTALPQVFPQLDSWKAVFRRSEFSMIAGVSGAGKSTLGLWMATKWVDVHGLKGLYFSADSAQLTIAARTVSMLTGIPVGRAESLVERHDDSAVEALRRVRGLEFSFEPEILLMDIELEVNAFIEKWGEGPDFIILDNLVDVEDEREGEWEALRQACKTATKMARYVDAAAIALHHMNDDEYKSICPPRKALMGKVSIKQALLLSVGDVRDGQMPLCPVKSRYGPQDKSGNSPVWLPYSPQTMSFN